MWLSVYLCVWSSLPTAVSRSRWLSVAFYLKVAAVTVYGIQLEKAAKDM